MFDRLMKRAGALDQSPIWAAENAEEPSRAGQVIHGPCRSVADILAPVAAPRRGAETILRSGG